jgi:outer membrane protein TolC
MTIRNDIHQVEEALFVYLTAADSADLAEQALKETCTQIDAGTAIELDLQNATRLDAQAQLQREQAEYNYLKSYFQLRHDSGVDSHL